MTVEEPGRPVIEWYPFTEHAQSDSCWSLSRGPDGRTYASACAEGVPGGFAKLVRFNDESDSLEYLVDVDVAVEDPRDSGRMTQCKIHYSFAPSMADGILYFATHLSATPYDEPLASAWKYVIDPARAFRGSALAAFDTRRGEVLWWDTLLPGEGCRCMVLDEERGVIYALSCPRDHLVAYDLKSRRRRDLGRIGNVNSQVLLLDHRHRVWTTSDDGRLVRYDPQVDRIERSPEIVMPFDRTFQTGWHSLLYDAVRAPDGRSVFASTYSARPQLIRLDLDDGDWGRIESLGPTTQPRSSSVPMDPMIDHCGGLVIGRDGWLYYVATRWDDPGLGLHTASGRFVEGVLWKVNPATGDREEVAVLDAPGPPVHYVSRASVGQDGDLFFAYVSAPPAGIFRLRLADDSRVGAVLPRVWG